MCGGQVLTAPKSYAAHFGIVNSADFRTFNFTDGGTTFSRVPLGASGTDDTTMTYYLKIFLYSFVPTIGVNLLTRPFWGDNVDTNTNLATFSIVLTIGLLPIYLLIINYFFAKKYKADNFILNGVIIIACVWLSSYFHFINWADTIGGRNNPDAGTEAVISFEKWTGTIFVIIGTIIGHINLIKQDKTAST